VDIGIVSAGGGQHVVVGRGVRSLRAYVDGRVVNDGIRSSIHEAVNERCVRVLKYLLNASRELVRWLRPVVVLHRNHENRLDLLSIGAQVAQNTRERN
jgi:hypothetical protein